MRFTAFFIFLVGSLLNSAGQNYISNGGFELTKGPVTGDHISINLCKDWFAPIMMGTDYFRILSRSGDMAYDNDLGVQEPHAGNAYAGICLHRQYLEYLQTRLMDTLRPGAKYLIEFYVSRAEKSISSVNELGVLFMTEFRRTIDDKGLTDEPSVKFTDRRALKDKDNWHKVSAVYEADGTETHLILGFFANENNRYSGFCHYFIDDVSLTPVEEVVETTIEDISEINSAVDNVEPVDPVIVPKVGETTVLKNIFFNVNESVLLPGSFTELDKVVDYLIQEENTIIVISGHTDNSGNETKNKLLSEARAKAVAGYLSEKGIDSARITSQGFGSQNPIASNNSEDGKKKNRRVEFLIQVK